MAHQNLRSDSPLARRIARSFLQFLSSVELSDEADGEALDVARDCLAGIFKIDRSPIGYQVDRDRLIDIFRASEGITDGRVNNDQISNAPGVSLGTNGAAKKGEDKSTEPHSPGDDELFGLLFDALEKKNYFRRMADGNDDQNRIERATSLFHGAVEQMKVAGCQNIDMKSLAETFKSQGNKAMQSSVFDEAIELYTFAIALCEDNAVYYCNRAAAYTHIQRYDEAVHDCLRSIEINPNYGKAYSRLGFAYYAQGRYRDAIDKGFARALLLDPNNESVKENIRAAEQKLRDGHRRSGPGQSSNSLRNSHSTSSSSFSSMPFDVNNLPSDLSSMLMNMAGNVYHEGHHGFAGEGEGEEGLSFGGNVDVNITEELSGALRSVMGGMFAGQDPPQGNRQQQNDDDGRGI